MYPHLPFDGIKLANDADGIHFGLMVGGELTSVVSLFQTGSIYQFRKFATRAKVQGCGYGSALLRHLIASTQEKAAVQLWCNARVSASGFYDKFGFVKSGAVFKENKLELLEWN